MAAQKPTKIDDVKRPEKVTPAATSRPIIVTNRSVLPNDPMVVPDSSADAKEAEAKPAEPTVHTAKVIKPLDSTLTAATTTADADTAPAAVTEDAKAVEPENPAPPLEVPNLESASDAKPPEAVDEAPIEPASDAKATEPAPADEPKPETPAEPSPSIKPIDDSAASKLNRDPEAELTAQEVAAAEAKAAREQELEALIVSGKYQVPINAVQRKRSRIHTVLLFLLALVLAAALFDAVLDAGLVNLPVNVPHTHFFSTT